MSASPTLQAKKVDYRDLPQPVRYEELQREVMSEWELLESRPRSLRPLFHCKGSGPTLPLLAA